MRFIACHLSSCKVWKGRPCVIFIFEGQGPSWVCFNLPFSCWQMRTQTWAKNAMWYSLHCSLSFCQHSQSTHYQSPVALLYEIIFALFEESVKLAVTMVSQGMGGAVFGTATKVVLRLVWLGRALQTLSLRFNLAGTSPYTLLSLRLIFVQDISCQISDTESAQFTANWRTRKESMHADPSKLHHKSSRFHLLIWGKQLL